MHTGLLGVIACESDQSGEFPFAERRFYRQLCEFAPRAGLLAYIFSPIRIDWALRRVIGYTYSSRQKRWMRKLFPLPDLVYDRCFYRNHQMYRRYQLAIQQLRQLDSVQFLGNKLGGKRKVYEALKHDTTLLPHLPHTKPLKHSSALIHWLDREQEVFLKPENGSQGRGALHIVKAAALPEQLYSVRGRSFNNAAFELSFDHPAELQHWIRRFANRRDYLIQPYLRLLTRGNVAFDIRALMQRDGSGQWTLTGIAARRGRLGSITSNLHGGGSALEAAPFLNDQFGEAAANELIAKIQELSLQIPQSLESHFGRLFELGIDFGIDNTGQVWILEINSKPGRNVFSSFHDRTSKIASIINPLRYARYLKAKTATNRRLGGQ